MDSPDEKVLDEKIIGLVQRAGPREKLPADAQARLEAHFRSEMASAGHAAGRRRRGIWSTAIAAGLVAAVGLFVIEQTPDPEFVASITQVEGTATWFDTTGTGPAAAGTSVNTGDVIATGAGRMLVRFPDGASIRIDQHSSVRVESRSELVLESGAVYVDSGGDADRIPSDLTFLAEGRRITHLGTQYEIRRAEGVLEVAVREGSVAVSGGNDVTGGTPGWVASATDNTGEALVFAATGDVRRQSITRYNGRWGWINEVSPGFEMVGHSYAEYVDWVAREQGLSVSWGSRDALEKADVVPAMADGDSFAPVPDQLEQILATAGLTAFRAEGVLEVRVAE